LKNLSVPLPCAAFATCLAGTAVLKKLSPEHEFRIKLPNDIVCETRKIGGVLCETCKTKKSIGLVAGIGLNINVSQEELQSTGTEATSIFSLTGKKTDLNDVRELLIKDAMNYFEMNEDDIISEFISKCVLVGRMIAVRDAFGELRGELKTILSDGAAVIETADGTKRKFYSGDFVLS